MQFAQNSSPKFDGQLEDSCWMKYFLWGITDYTSKNTLTLHSHIAKKGGGPDVYCACVLCSKSGEASPAAPLPTYAPAVLCMRDNYQKLISHLPLVITNLAENIRSSLP